MVISVKSWNEGLLNEERVRKDLRKIRLALTLRDGVKRESKLVILE
jgi:hypothetical protein